jgi:hypothetical protein
MVIAPNPFVGDIEILVPAIIWVTPPLAAYEAVPVKLPKNEPVALNVSPSYVNVGTPSNLLSLLY